MVVKMTKEQENRLRCICGLCDHSYSATTCPYNKICDAHNPNEEEMKQIKKLLADVVALNVKNANNVKIAKKEAKCQTKTKSSTKSKK